MKNKFLHDGCLSCIGKMFLFLIMVPTLSMAQNQSLKPDEAAVKKVIEDETHYLNIRDYDKWAACWIQEPDIVWNWVGPSSNTVFLGFKDLGTWAQGLIKNNPNPQPEVIKTDYDYHFNGNVAIVRFKENGIDQVQILEKRDGQWKLYRRFMWDVNGFATAKKKGLLDRMAGDWELIPETVHLKDSVFTIPLFKAQMTRTTEGIQGVLQSTYMDRNGNKYDAYNKLWLLCDEGSGKIAYAETIKSANSNLFVVNGTGDISENIMKIDAATLTQDSKANIQWKILPDGHLSLETKVFDMQGKELDFTSLEFQRK